VLALYGVDYAILPAFFTAQSAFQPLATTERGDVTLVAVRDHRPRAFVAARAIHAGDDRTIRDQLLAKGPLELGAIRLSGDGDARDASLAPCTIDEPRPERVVLHCTASAPSYAVLLDAWAPGWTATVDGAPAKIERADLLARAVAIDAGEHTIVFRYRTPWLRTGAIMSVLAWCALGVLVIRRRR
jgi:hypothetical protein